MENFKKLLDGLKETSNSLENMAIKSIVKDGLSILEKNYQNLLTFINTESIQFSTLYKLIEKSKEAISTAQSLLNDTKFNDEFEKDVAYDLLNTLEGDKGIRILVKWLQETRPQEAKLHEQQKQHDDVGVDIENILAAAKAHKQTYGESADHRVLLEHYGLALALSQIIDDNVLKTNVEKKIKSALENFIGKQLNEPIGSMEVDNLLKNIHNFKQQLITFRTNAGPAAQHNVSTYFLNNQKFFENYLKDIFIYLFRIMGDPPKDCQYAFVGLGSLATGLVTSYSDIEYVILAQPYRDDVRQYFINLADLFELLLISFGESSIYQAKHY